MRTLVIALLVVACGTSPEPVPVSVATGELEAWVAGPALPTPRANHCIAAVEDWVVVVGGNFKQADGTFAKTDEIHAARMVGGELGPWHSAGMLPSPVTECTATADGRTLYVLDGIYDVESDGRQVLTATLDDGGVLSPLVAMTTLPQIAISSEAVVRGGELLMMDTVLPAEVDGDRTITLRTAALPSGGGGGGGAWFEDDWQIGFRAQAQYAFTDGFAYTLGGYGGGEGNPVTDEVFVAAINAAGNGIGVGRATTKLPEAVAFGEAVAVDGFVFVVGGRAQVLGGVASTAVYAAEVQPEGGLGAWATVEGLPMGRTNHELVVVGDHLVIAGGAAGAGGDAQVFVTRVRFPVE